MTLASVMAVLFAVPEAQWVGHQLRTDTKNKFPRRASTIAAPRVRPSSQYRSGYGQRNCKQGLGVSLDHGIASHGPREAEARNDGMERCGVPMQS